MEELQSKESLREDAKRKFEHAWSIPRISRKISGVTFEELLDMFRSDCNTFLEIGELLGVSRERIRQIYNKYFRAVVGKRKTGLVRKHICTLKRHALAREELPEDTVARIVAEAAKAAGCAVRQVPHKGSRYQNFCVRSLVVNGKRCPIYSGHHKHQPNGEYPERGYFHVVLTAPPLENVSYVIFLQDIEEYPRRIFIIPVAVFRSVLGAREHAQVYIPVEHRPVYRNHSPAIDFWQYENAWHLLGPTT